jgi:aryl-alcohol dehydrogenase-like predicted oxidoreductase
MDRASVPGTDISLSRLGFGLAPLGGRVGRAESLRLLERAFDAGITHFDTARSYGYGQVESVLGDFLERHRDEVTVTTKLGITPPPDSSGFRAAKSLARAVTRVAPGARRLLRRGGQRMVSGGRFSAAEARESLETSLRELRVDRVDLLLLHECSPEDLHSDGLLGFLDEAVREGKVGRYGIGTDPASTAAILRESPGSAGVVQIANSAVAPNLESLDVPPESAVITHTPLGGLSELTDAVASLMLAYALWSNPRGAVLFGSTDEAHIEANVAVAENFAYDPDQLRRFAQQVRSSQGR